MSHPNDFQPITIAPMEIEERSFAIIAQEFGAHDFTPEQFTVIQRIIHATADFDLGRSVAIHPQAIAAGIQAIRAGRPIIADVQMVQVGISKPRLSRFGSDVFVHISDSDVAEEAKATGVTRAIMAMRKAARTYKGGIYAIGNAPTALLELISMVKSGIAKPDLIVGVPVGFVSAAESKEELLKLDIPYITNRGRKGGSPVAVATINALSLLAVQSDQPAGEARV
ncbi:precorrin-8X methylmutase [Sulfoacidibacillus thermotolerans]|uniref:Precorrin-8X methylmutase n=1 Tax=Sulfoacidibacillus thermotolerans TaxID=1765684 RepID=A0A2U3DBS9_SULT2|nr:precorrin-8X methylmutase [Sulfoacidibacillus thermotolerans]PWI58734.1 precorrin-8X methylmutase [Sulfoacidibacillus thermotolerans]